MPPDSFEETLASIESPPTEVAATPPVEAPKAAPPAPSSVQADALRILMQKEASIREQSESLKTREAAVSRASRIQELAKSDPYALFKELGVDYNGLTDRVLKDPDMNPSVRVESQLSALQQRLDSQERAAEQAKLDAAQEEARNNIRTFVDGSEAFPLTREMAMQDAVVERIRQAEQAGQAISEEDAAGEVERSLSELVGKVLKNPKLREALLGNATPKKSGPSTLTNNISQTVSTKTEPGVFTTEEERLLDFASRLNFS